MTIGIAILLKKEQIRDYSVHLRFLPFLVWQNLGGKKSKYCCFVKK